MLRFRCPDRDTTLHCLHYHCNTSSCIVRVFVTVTYHILLSLFEIGDLLPPRQNMTGPASGMDYRVRWPTNHWMSTTRSTHTSCVTSTQPHLSVITTSIISFIHICQDTHCKLMWPFPCVHCTLYNGPWSGMSYELLSWVCRSLCVFKIQVICASGVC